MMNEAILLSACKFYTRILISSKSSAYQLANNMSEGKFNFSS